MMKPSNNFLLFDISDGKLFYGVYCNREIKNHVCISINTDLSNNSSVQEKMIYTISKLAEECNIPLLHTRVYWSIQTCIEQSTLSMIRNRFYTKLGVYINIVPQNLRSQYINLSANSDTILYGLCNKEFQKVVICGSFRKHLSLVKRVFDYCIDRDIEVLSPKSLQLDSIFKDSFVLFHGEKITSERETHWIEHKHTEAIRAADAVIICNQQGYVGPTTIYEIGFAQALGKRIVFVDDNQGEFDINFPRDTGLLGF